MLLASRKEEIGCVAEASEGEQDPAGQDVFVGGCVCRWLPIDQDCLSPCHHERREGERKSGSVSQEEWLLGRQPRVTVTEPDNLINSNNSCLWGTDVV